MEIIENSEMLLRRIYEITGAGVSCGEGLSARFISEERRRMPDGRYIGSAVVVISASGYCDSSVLIGMLDRASEIAEGYRSGGGIVRIRPLGGAESFTAYENGFGSAEQRYEIIYIGGSL